MTLIGGGAVSGVGDGCGSGSWACTAHTDPKITSKQHSVDIFPRNKSINYFRACSSSRPHPTESDAAETAAVVSLYLSRADWFLHQPRPGTSRTMRVLPDILQDNRAMWQ